MKTMSQSQRISTILLLIFGLATLSSVVVLLIQQSRLPSDGTLWMDYTSPAVRIEAVLRSESAMRGGDRLLAINDVPVQTWLDRALRGERAPDWQIGETLTYQIADGAESQILLIPLRTLETDRLFVLRWGVYLAAVGSLCIGVYSLLKFPHEPAAQALFLAVLALSLPLALHMHVGLLTTPRLLRLQNIIKLLGRLLVTSAFLSITLMFPLPKKWLARKRYVLPAFYVVPPLITLLVGLLFARMPSQRLILAWKTVVWFNILMIVLSAISVLHSYLTVQDSLVRGQLQWMVWGILCGALPYFLLTGLPEALMDHAIVNVGITSIFIMVVPFTIAVAIAKYWVFDVGAVVRRTLLMVVFALFLTGIYYLLSTILKLSTSISDPIDELVIVFITTFLVGTVFWSYHGHLSNLIGNLIYHRPMDPQRLLNDVGAALTRTIRMKDIQLLLTETIPSYVGASFGQLMVLNPLQDRLVSVEDDGFSLPDEARAFVDRWKLKEGLPLRRALLPEWVPAGLQAFMVAQNVDLLFILLSGDKAFGIWGIGPPYGRQPYTTAEVRILWALARQAAVSLEKARLVNRLEERGEFLEAEMERRMHLLEQERNRLNTILQNMVDGLLVTSPDDEIMMVNPAFEDLVHRSARNLVAQPIAGVIKADVLQTALKRSLEHRGNTEIVEFALRQRVIRAVTMALHDRSAVITILRDVTREVEVDRMKSEFISSVSHELRTPLTSILGFTKLIQRAFEGEISRALPADDADVQRARARIEQNLDIMLEESGRLTELIDDVLDIAALDAGKMEWHDQLYNFPALLQRVADRVRPVAQEKGLEIRLRVDRDVLQLEADPDRIEQVLTNLISNAIKFTSDGMITVSARLLEAGRRIHGWRVPKGGALHVMVKDTGVGIPSAAQKDLFQRFRQVSDVTGQKPRGSGLGLVICREIVTHYGGIIWVESEAGEGSTFAFTLPVHQDGSVKTPEAEDVAVPRQ